jgi:hypothetical protein
MSNESSWLSANACATASGLMCVPDRVQERLGTPPRIARHQLDDLGGVVVHAEFEPPGEPVVVDRVVTTLADTETVAVFTIGMASATAAIWMRRFRPRTIIAFSSFPPSSTS